jgi:hypothetical protein
MTGTTIPLTERQARMVEQSAAELPPALHEEFFKYIEDVLRPKRTPWDSDVAHACCSGLVKYSKAHSVTSWLETHCKRGRPSATALPMARPHGGNLGRAEALTFRVGQARD